MKKCKKSGIIIINYIYRRERDMNKKAQEFIRKKKKRKAVKRFALAIFIIIVAMIIFAYKSSIFNIKGISVEGIVTLNKDELEESLSTFKGKNIFTVNYNEIKDEVKKNPYVSDVVVKKKGINALNIIIKENKIAFYIEEGDTKKIVNNNLTLVEKVSSVEGRNLVKLIGVKDNGKDIGETIVENKHLNKILSDFYPIIENMPPEHKIESLNVEDITNIKINIKDVKVFLGNTDKLVEKMNLVLNAIDQGVITKGYIDLSFDGPPVIKQES